MSLTDDELLRQLRRRVDSDALSEPDRVDVLAAVRSHRAANGRRLPWSRGLRWALTTATAATVLATLVTTSLVLGPRATPAPGSSIPPGSTAATPPSASVGPTQEPASAVEVFTAQELSEMIGGPRVGDVVLARAQINQMRTDRPIGKRCPPAEPCYEYVLEGVAGKNVVGIGWRTAAEGEGTRYGDESSVRWLTPITMPTEPGLFAFRIQADAVEYLGPVVQTAEGEPLWDVEEVQAGQHAQPSYDVFAVHGWLVAAGPFSCPAPQELIEGNRPDLRWYCSGSYIASEPVRTIRRLGDGGSQMIIPDGLRVQNGAYEEFATDPDYDDQGSFPREGVYLVRSAGCPRVTLDECPVWQALGRFDEIDSGPIATPSPPPGDSAPPVADAGQLVAMANDSRWADAVVMARVRLDRQALIDQHRRGPICIRGDSCVAALLGDVSPTLDVYAGWRVAAEGNGTRFEEDGVIHWREPLAIPTDAGLFAFRVGRNTIEFLGPVVQEEDGAIVWQVTDIQAGNHADPSDDLYAVEGWLVATSPAPCEYPDDPPPGADRGYWCGRSWLTQTKMYSVNEDRSAFFFVLDGLHAQWDAYDEFAPPPIPEGLRGWEPRFGTYLVRSAGCPAVVMGDCPVWSMVGRLDDFMRPGGESTDGE